ncbi:hypothetical protein [Actinopolymorpha rutila]|uniref:Uncharacterized protein n=1 Tax=Actinopolymorpha rutila TaxID=446787 RepID=A0A852ZJJ3_9ACTN|nr:hypothetical protein [Actinopolymorpha rutila]NYH92413.1 hypothetical protein [Actinopolymorpha rutila]
MKARGLLAAGLLAATSLVLTNAQPAAAEDELVPVESLGTQHQIPKPTLTASGPHLILSDSPELPDADTALPGAFYRDSVDGLVRVLGHQQNNAQVPMVLGVAVTNTSDGPVLLFDRGVGRSADYWPDVAGQNSLTAFMNDHHSARYLTTLKAGETYWSTRTVAPTYTEASIQEFAAVTSGTAENVGQLQRALDPDIPTDQLRLPRGAAPARVTVTTVGYWYTEPRTADPLTLPVLPGDTDHVRGTFDYSDLYGTVPVEPDGGVQRLSVDSAPPGKPWNDSMPGEYRLGRSAVDGDRAVYNDGNYGVLYHLDTVLKGDRRSAGTPVGLFLNPAGGGGHFVVAVNDSLHQSPYVDWPRAWHYDQAAFGARDVHLRLTTSLTGGSAGPQVLLFAPNYTSASGS